MHSSHREEGVDAEELDGEVHGVVAQREAVLVGQREHQPALNTASHVGRRWAAAARPAAAVAATVATAAVTAVAVPRRRRQDLQLHPGVAYRTNGD